MPAAGGAPAQSPNEEQRRSPRASLVVQVEFKTTRNFTLGHSQDVSEGGLSVATPETVESRTEVVIRFNLPPYPGGAFIESQGLVTHVRPGEYMGIQFLQLQDWQREAIIKFVQQALEGSR